MAVFATQSVTIANGASLSAGLRVKRGMTVVGIQMPAAWTAANLTFQGSAAGSTYDHLYDQYGVEVAATAAASRYIALEPSIFAAVPYLKVRSGTSATPVNQGAERTLTLVLRPVA